MVFVRNVWKDISASSFTFEQTFSNDGGKTRGIARIAPEPAKWSALVFKIRDLDTHFVGWNPAEVRAQGECEGPAVCARSLSVNSCLEPSS
jgi:hypothetical protein